MPTPVGVARQCLTDEAARALDDAVAVARRRSHTQTTSIHALSALLALPSSILREACTRARNSQCSSRLQFRALELCLGVSLDRLPSSKTLDEAPPISNSLMAAIKRSQAYQRRHPDSFHLMQIHYNQQPASVLKVEIKHFILSILDDPIVSRVLGDAGFRSCDIKLAIIHPPVPRDLKFSRTRCPPLFLCNLTGSDPVRFPFGGVEGGDENSKRIGEALATRKDKGKNLLLLGVCAADALNKFVDCVNRNEAGVLPSEIAGLTLISIEKEIVEFVNDGNDRGKMDLKLNEVRQRLEQCSSPGIALNIGELKAWVDENASFESVSFLVSEVTVIMENFREKMWLMASAARYETYSKLLGQFPAVEKDWDLQLLPITSISPMDGFGSKSSLMGSFIPFGGFFASPCEMKNPLSSTNQPITRCHLCNAKYEQEVAAMLKTDSKTPVSDRYSDSLPSWLQMAQLDKSPGSNEAKTKSDGTTSSADILGLQKKWDDICQQLHQAHPLSRAGALPNSHGTSPCVSSVTTDLGLSAAPRTQLLITPQSHNNRKHLQHLPSFNSSEFRASESTSTQTGRSSPPPNHPMEERFDLRDYKSISKVLTDKVGWQQEAICAIARAISRSRAGYGRICGSTARRDTWLAFIGPDKVGKKRVSSVLAKTVFGSEENLVYVDLSCHEVQFRGKTTVDVVAMELRKKPSSVILLENVDKCDDQTRDSLFQAVTTGRFPDSYRNEVSIKNTIFVMASTAGNKNSMLQRKPRRFSEERILGVKTREIQLSIEQVDCNSSSLTKRKLGATNSREQDLNCEASKKVHKAFRSSIDLNLPVEESDRDGYDSDSISENSQAWLDDFLDKVDEKVVFKPFDFDGLADRITREIDKQIQKVFGFKICLEVEEEVMAQILSACWLPERRNVMEEWVETVLTRAFAEAKHKYRINAQSVVRLSNVEGVLMEDWAPGISLPSEVRL